MCDAEKTVQIDIKPGSSKNSINLRSRGVTPVAILSTEDFDASTVDGSSVVFAGSSPERARRGVHYDGTYYY